MKSDHDTRHEARILEAAGTDADIGGALHAAGLESCAGCRAFVDELVGMNSQLVRVAQVQRTLERAALEEPENAGEQRAWDALDRAGLVHGRPRRSLRWLAVAAAAVLLVSTVVLSGLFERDDEDIHLGPADAVECVRPLGEVETYTPFTWRASVPSGGWFVARAEGRRTDGSLFELQSAHLRTLTWEPTTEDARGWPPRLTWSVSMHDASGARVAFKTAEAALRSP